MVGVDPEARRVLVARLRHDSDKMLSERVRQAAASTGVSERTLWRWLSEEGPAGGADGARFVLTTGDMDSYVAHRGNTAAVWRERYPDGAGPSLRTLQRAFDRELRPGDRAAIVDGAEGRRRHQVYLRWEASNRNAIWEADHKQLEILVLAPRCQRPQKPWVTMFLDAFSRLIMGWAIALTPSAATVLAALGRGIRVDPARGPFGGVPSMLRFDNGLEFAADALAQAAGVLGCETVATQAYSPHLKGKIERANRTVTQQLISGLPFFTDGPRAIDGHLYGPDADPMTVGAFVALFDEWVRDYNTVRPHAGLGGQTPLQRWSADATPLQTVAEEELRWMLLAGEERIVHKDGIHFHGLTFIAAELNGMVGQSVEVRYVPHDDRRVEVFVEQRWLATAWPQNALSTEDRDRVLARRRTDAAEQGRRQRRSSRQARVRLAAMTEPGEAEITNVVALERGRSELGRAGDSELQRQARLDLLDLGAGDDAEDGSR